MSIPFSRAPHIEGVGGPLHPSQAPNAALLIDFDNVTMGMRSDLSKELKTLLNSDVIRGKVTVQRAYADWRRYPQYIVPLSEASIDLIFAPAYGSSKKNATDIRMAIDGMELVFTRPEIGTYILLTGDSDFSSLVLKLKEYGKYVIGVGIQESSSDILVQNCDEYYSYTALSGLRKTDDGGGSQLDPWVLVERAVEQMARRGDVMRSDRLKQVMLEIDPGFDEKGLGFNKFSRFLSEAGKKGLIQLQRMENGQYEIVPPKGGQRTDEKKSSSGSTEREGRRPDRSRNDRGRSSSAESGRPKEASAGRAPVDAGRAPVEDRSAAPSPSLATTPAPSSGDAVPPAGDMAGLAEAYDLLRRAIGDLLEDQESDAARDSDVKRRMLALDGAFDETKLGFPKFSRFLQRAQDHEIVEIRKGEGSHSEVALGSRSTPPAAAVQATGEASTQPIVEVSTESVVEAPGDAAVPAGTGAKATEPGRATAGRLRPRESSGGPRGRGGDDHPPLLEGQIVRRATGAAKEPAVAVSEPESPADGAATASVPAGSDVFDPALLRLPTGAESVIQYLSNSYGGVGKKTAETLVEALGDRLFHVLQSEPSRIGELLPAARAEKVIEGWEADYGRRKERHLAGVASGSGGRGASASPGDEPAPSASAGSDSARSTAAEATDPNGEPASAPRGGRARRTRGGR